MGTYGGGGGGTGGGVGDGGGGGNNFVDTGQAKQGASDRLDIPACFKLIVGDSKYNTVEKAQKELSLRSIDFADLGAFVIRGTPQNWGGTFPWGKNNGAVIVLNSRYFPDDTAQNVDVFGQQQSAVDVFNHLYKVNLDGLQVEEAVILHELRHILGGASDRVIDSAQGNADLLAACFPKSGQ